MHCPLISRSGRRRVAGRDGQSHRRRIGRGSSGLPQGENISLPIKCMSRPGSHHDHSRNHILPHMHHECPRLGQPNKRPTPWTIHKDVHDGLAGHANGQDQQLAPERIQVLNLKNLRKQAAVMNNNRRNHRQHQNLARPAHRPRRTTGHLPHSHHSNLRTHVIYTS